MNTDHDSWTVTITLRIQADKTMPWKESRKSCVVNMLSHLWEHKIRPAMDGIGEPSLVPYKMVLSRCNPSLSGIDERSDREARGESQTGKTDTAWLRCSLSPRVPTTRTTAKRRAFRKTHGPRNASSQRRRIQTFYGDGTGWLRAERLLIIGFRR